MANIDSHVKASKKALERHKSANSANVDTPQPNGTHPPQKPYLTDFRFAECSYNPNYEKGLIPRAFEFYLKYNKSDKSLTTDKACFTIERLPKWLTTLRCNSVDKETGEVTDGVYLTDSHKSGVNRKIKALSKFADHFQPLYEKREVSMFFYTLTRADKAKVNIKQLVNTLRKGYERNGSKWLGYVWTLEVSFDSQTNSHHRKNGHIHYHLAIATERMNLKGKKFKRFMLSERIWKQRTEVDFVHSNVKRYLSKYMAKDRSRIKGLRSYGVSLPKSKVERK
jgi:hypothetical protein